MGVTDLEKRKTCTENLFVEIMAKNFLNLRKEMHKFQQAQHIPTRINLKKCAQGHIIIKLSNSTKGEY